MNSCFWAFNFGIFKSFFSHFKKYNEFEWILCVFVYKNVLIDYKSVALNTR